MSLRSLRVSLTSCVFVSYQWKQSKLNQRQDKTDAFRVGNIFHFLRSLSSTWPLASVEWMSSRLSAKVIVQNQRAMDENKSNDIDEIVYFCPRRALLVKRHNRPVFFPRQVLRTWLEKIRLQPSDSHLQRQQQSQRPQEKSRHISASHPPREGSCECIYPSIWEVAGPVIMKLKF